jgi:hypothetical protein
MCPNHIVSRLCVSHEVGLRIPQRVHKIDVTRSPQSISGCILPLQWIFELTHQQQNAGLHNKVADVLL